MNITKLDDLYDRVTSRKFLLALLSVGFALWNYNLGLLTPVEFQASIIATVTTYGVIEGAIDYQNAKREPAVTIDIDAFADEIIERMEARIKAAKNESDANQQSYVGLHTT